MTASDGLVRSLQETRTALHRYLVLRGAASDEAEDVLQEMSLKLAMGGIGPVAEPRAYLYRMATNQFFLHRRTQTRRERREVEWMEGRGVEADGVDPQPSDEQRLIQREQLLIVRAVLDRLPERTRTIFLRFRVERHAQRDIARDMGISISAIEKHLTRAYSEIAAAKAGLDGDRTLPRHLSWDRGAL